MIHTFFRLSGATLLFFLILTSRGASQTILTEPEAGEKAVERPYEMAEAKRVEPMPPTIRFDQLRGWRMRMEGGEEAILQATRTQNVWNRPVARLHYRREAPARTPPRIFFVPPFGILLPVGADCVDMWVYGNRWHTDPVEGTPPVQIRLHLRDSIGKMHDVLVETVNWREWFLVHRRLPKGMRFPVLLEYIEISGGTQSEWRDLYFDSVYFYQEPFPQLQFARRPQRNLTLLEGQSPGANTGPGRLPFPTREETILPMQLSGSFRNDVSEESRNIYMFNYQGSDCLITYHFEALKGLQGIRAAVDNAPAGVMFINGGVRRAVGRVGGGLTSVQQVGSVVIASYTDGTELRLRLWQKSLVVDVINRSGQAVELQLGRIIGLKQPRTVWIPFITCGATNPSVLLSRAGTRWVFTSLWVDWYRSNGSELYGAEYASGSSALINGGVRYLAKTDGRRNPLYERLFLTVSPDILEVLPTIPNPVGLHAAEAADRLWQGAPGPKDYDVQVKASRRLIAYGIAKMILGNHENTWRDAGESFTLRENAAPQKGGNAALQRYVSQIRSLGWLCGLYTNYCSIAPVNKYWGPSFVLRTTNNDWTIPWPRTYSLKPLWGVEFDALLAPRIKKAYDPNAAYTDVHTAAAPWYYTDYDARVPGAGTFAQTYYAYGELLRNDSRVYEGPVFSEGTFQWLYAGLTDGNHARAYTKRRLAREPLLPMFFLYQIHPKECDIGMGYTAAFCDGIPDWDAPQNLDHSVDRFLLTTLAYGNIGYLVEEKYGLQRMCRSYYMLQQVQTRYALKAPVRILYWDGKQFRTVSEAVVMDLADDRRQLYIEYPAGLELWLNDHPTEDWRIQLGPQQVTLPPAGWAVWQRDGSLLSYSALQGGGKVDYLRSPSYTYLDGRGKLFSVPEAASDGGLAISRLSDNVLQVIRISGKDVFTIRRPYGVQGVVTACEAYDAEGHLLDKPVLHESGSETQLEPVANAVRYVLRFSGKPAWSVAPAQDEGVAGSTMPLKISGLSQVNWQTAVGEVKNNQLVIPGNVPVGTWIGLRATANGESRETGLRVCSPAEWRWRVIEHSDDTHLILQPSWSLKGLGLGDFSILVKSTTGWDVDPQRFAITALSPPQELEMRLRSTAVAGYEGALQISLTGLPSPSTTTLHLRRVTQKPVVADFQNLFFSWGITRRREEAQPEPGNSGAFCRLDNGLSVGGLVKRGIFAHPPFLAGVGYTWLETEAIDLPTDPCQFHSYIGIKDGGDLSDGVLFRVAVIDEQGKVHPLAERMGYPGRWGELTGDLGAFAGQRVQIQLIADCGPNDNTTDDWACWGEPVIEFSVPRTATQVSAWS